MVAEHEVIRRYETPTGFSEVSIDLERVDELIDQMVAPSVPSELLANGDRRTRKRLDTRRRILRAAWRLFVTVGYDGTTVHDITESADVGKGTFFSHFRSKGDLALHLCQHRRDTVIGLFDQGAFGDGSASSRIVRLMTNLAALNGAADPESRIMNEIMLRRFFEEPIIMAPGSPQIETVLASVITEGVHDGEFAAGTDPEHAAQMLYGSFYSTKAAWLRPGPEVVPFDLVERVEGSIRTILRGLASVTESATQG